MKKIIFTIVFYSFYITLFSQNVKESISDTIEIDEIKISSTVPITFQSELDKAKSNKYLNLDELNGKLSGVSVIGRGAFAMEPMLNVFTSGQINVTIDGMKMFGACTDKMDPITSYFEPLNLQSLTINQGSNGLKNGSTIGGTYDMNLIFPILNKSFYKIGASYDAVSNGKTEVISFNIGKKRLAYRFSGVNKKFDNYKDGNKESVPFTQYSKINFQQALLYSISKHRKIKFDFIFDNAKDVGYPALPMDVGKAQGRIFSLEYLSEKSILKIENLKIKLYYNKIFHLMDDSKRDSLYFLTNSNGRTDSIYMKMDMPGWSHTAGFYIEGKKKWSDKNELSFKIDQYLYYMKAEMTMFMENMRHPGEPPMYAETLPESQRNVGGLYLQNTTKFNEKFLLNCNVRVDFSSTKLLSDIGKSEFSVLNYDTGNPYTKTVKSSNLILFYSPTKAITFSSGIGVGERLPSLSEQFGFYLYNALDGFDYVGNPNIKTEKSINYNLIFKYTKEKIGFSFENYYYMISDYIFGTYSTEYDALNLYASGVKIYQNIDRADVFSSNIKFDYSPLDELNVSLSSKYNSGKFEDNTPLPLIPAFKNIVSISYTIKNLLLNFETEYSAAQNQINANYGEQATDGFTLLNFGAVYNLNFSKYYMTIRPGIKNILNKAYSEHLDWGDYYRPGRNYYISVFIEI